MEDLRPDWQFEGDNSNTKKMMSIVCISGCIQQYWLYTSILVIIYIYREFEFIKGCALLN